MHFTVTICITKNKNANRVAWTIHVQCKLMKTHVMLYRSTPAAYASGTKEHITFCRAEKHPGGSCTNDFTVTHLEIFESRSDYILQTMFLYNY
jgi:hypothetical protein